MGLPKYFMFVAFYGAVLTAPSNSGETSSETNRRIAKECFSKHSLSREVLVEFHQNPEDPPKKMLCYMKCFLERKGLIDEGGYINMEYNSGENYGGDSQEDSDGDSSASDEYDAVGESGEEDLSCLKRLEPIKNCGDMKGVLKCLPSIRRNENE